MSGTPFHEQYTESDNNWSTRIKTNFQLDFVHVHYQPTATVGNRRVVLEVLNQDGDIIADFHAAVNIGANTLVHVEFIPGHDRETQLSGPNSDRIVVGIPQITILAPYSIRVRDAAGIDAADTIEVNLWGHYNV